jgi:SAM-dependent methyltransferase
MVQPIDRRLLTALTRHTRSLGLKRFFQSMGYERSGELPLIVSRLEPLFGKPLRYLDIGSGDAVFPTFVLKHSAWDVTCVDKFSSVHRQHLFAQRVMNGADYTGRFHVVEKDFLQTELPAESFDVITNISVIEHFEGESDSLAMERSAQLLKRGGMYILTTLMNDGHYKEFFVKKSTYGEEYSSRPVFFQRHYDVVSFNERVIEPSGLQEIERLFFGDYGFQFAEKLMVMPWPWKSLKLFYQWATPAFARKFLSYRDYPVSRENMHMYTSSGVFVVLRKPE